MGDSDLKTFSGRLKELRKSLNLTQAEFVKDIDITAAALSAYEKNLKNPSIGVVKRIASKYHVSIDWLCGLSDKKSRSGEITTYGDLLRWLGDISIRFPHSMKSVKEQGKECASILLDDEILSKILMEWDEYEDLCFKKGKRGIKLFFIWLNDTINQYNDLELPKNEDYQIYLDKLKNRL